MSPPVTNFLFFYPTVKEEGLLKLWEGLPPAVVRHISKILTLAFLFHCFRVSRSCAGVSVCLHFLVMYSLAFSLWLNKRTCLFRTFFQSSSILFGPYPLKDGKHFSARSIYFIASYTFALSTNQLYSTIFLIVTQPLNLVT